MIKTTLIWLLGLFFVLNGINHLFNTRVLAEYAERRGMISPKLMVRASGLLLVAGGLSLGSGVLKLWGIAALCLFLIVAALTIHRFWSVDDRELRWLEAAHFTKNLAILTELLYLAVT